VNTLLAEQIQAVLDTLAVAESQAATLQATMHLNDILFGLEYSDIKGDLTRFTWKLRHMKRLAEHRGEQTSS